MIAYLIARLRHRDAIICRYCRRRWQPVSMPGWRFPVHYVGGKPCRGSEALR
ncbi:hypothetical protein PBI_THONKO_89 [Mycobacterium phage Thonko]|uniref:Uncharacterized protein n=1 Tax=Mycobacterium phage Thonko TaxID=2282910 RepID=A0A346FCD4_9CAUD|nr:hypothetical protein I5G57_gp089 [Mycobacterium phage Thonko]AXN53359.1 hypothetical protein PBI_THONKO_89 [Mycobacterium phage Thonko]